MPSLPAAPANHPPNHPPKHPPKHPPNHPAPQPAHRRVLVVGGANLDLIATGLAGLALGDSNPGRLHSQPGGVARNIAERLAQLGQAVRLVSVLCDDEAGRQILRQGQAAGIDMGGCQVLSGAATARYVSLHQPDGELLIALNDMALLRSLTADRLQGELPALQQAAAVVVDANLEPATLAALWALPAAVPLWADAVSAAKCQRLRPGLARLHSLKPNRLEALQLSGLPADTADAALAAWLLDAGVRQVALSLGASGLLLCGRDANGQRWQQHQPALPVAVRNVTGAGDALLAGLLHAQLAACPPAAAAAFAVACASHALAGLALPAFLAPTTLNPQAGPSARPAPA